jgi:hypothetical protein
MSRKHNEERILCIHMYVNAKMIPAETSRNQGRGRRRRAVEGVNSSMIYLIHCKNLCKCYKVPLPSTIIIKKNSVKEIRYSCIALRNKARHLSHRIHTTQLKIHERLKHNT